MKCQLTNRFFQIVSLINDEQKIARDYGVGHLLFGSEIKLIEMIYQHPDINAGELSDLLAITKGALTQLSNKLIRKGLAESYTKPGNKKEKYYRLTGLGEKARSAHQSCHAEANKALCKYFCSLNAEESRVIYDFLDKLLEYMPICEFSCSYHEDGTVCQE